MARKKRRRRSTARRRVTHASNPTHHRRRRSTRRHYRRNSGFSFGGRGIVGKVTGAVKDGVIGGATVVAGEAVSRLVRSDVFGMAGGDALSDATEAGVAIAAGLIAEKMFGRQVGRDIVVGGFAGVMRSTIKSLGIPVVASALSGDGPRILLPRGQRRLGSYPSPLAGYPAPAVAGYGNDYDY